MREMTEMEKQKNNKKKTFADAEKENASGKSYTPENRKKMTSKQLVALIGAALLVVLYIATLIVAILDNSDSGRWFMTCIFATVAVPMLIWIYTWLYGKFTGKHTIADAPHRPTENNVTRTSAQTNPIDSDSGQEQS